MAPALDIRRYRPDDQDRVWELHEQALRDVGAFDAELTHLDSDLTTVETAYLEVGGEFLVGEVDGEIVAMGAFRPAEGYVTDILDGLSDSTAQIKRMRVDPKHQRRGYGQQIYDELERTARNRDFTDLVLDTRPHQTGAKRLYEANGFEQVHSEHVQSGEEAIKIIFYWKELVQDQ